MKISLSNHRPNTNSAQAEKAFYKRLAQDYFFIRKVAISRYNPGGVEPMISHRIEKISFHLDGCKHIQQKLKKLLDKYHALLQSIQD